MVASRLAVKFADSSSPGVCLLPASPLPPHQIHASAEALRLITFDADGTLYADGHHFEQDNEMIQLFMALMKVRRGWVLCGFGCGGCGSAHVYSQERTQGCVSVCLPGSESGDGLFARERLCVPTVVLQVEDD
jgi:hypothetical protein